MLRTYVYAGTPAVGTVVLGFLLGQSSEEAQYLRVLDSHWGYGDGVAT